MMKTNSLDIPDVTIGVASPWSLGDGTELWRRRELLLFLVWRQLRIQYQETILGLAWAILRPLLAMLVFSIIFGRLARLPSDGLPYPLFACAALVPWTYFSTALTASATSLVSHAGLVTKVYFPRLVLPLAAVLAGLVDFVVAGALIAILMAHYHVAPGLALIALPAPLALLLVSAAGLGIWLAALSVRYRDVRVALPFGLQILLYAAPVIWPASLLPADLRVVYGLYPMVGVIEGFRASLFAHGPMPWDLLGAGALSAAVILLTGLWYFRRVDRVLADIV